MPEPIYAMRSLESQNKYPDCLWMQLEAIPGQGSAADPQQLDLYLTLSFSEHWETLLDGRIKFGLQGGTLKLNLENCEIPLSSRHLAGSLTLTQSENNALQNSTDTEGFLAERTHSSSSIACHISETGSDTHPTWTFEVEAGEPVLKGVLKSAKLGQISAKPCIIEAAFTVEKQDICLTDAEGLWRHDITPNQHAILERLLVHYLADIKFQPYLSWALLYYDCSVQEKGEIGNSDLKAESQLQEAIEQIIAAKTPDFRDLAKLANLDLNLDFAGSNLRGTTLSGIDFSSANLYRTNFRGSDLSDADFSDANLRNAILGGADLSGAFLGDAELSGADLHRASLALTNLNGANLSGANLREANVGNTNFGSANVEKAHFGNNPGMTEEMKQHLRERGAIFSES